MQFIESEKFQSKSPVVLVDQAKGWSLGNQPLVHYSVRPKLKC